MLVSVQSAFMYQTVKKNEPFCLMCLIYFRVASLMNIALYQNVGSVILTKNMQLMYALSHG